MRAVVVLVALAACGDNVAGIALEDYGEARRTAECEQLTRCGLFSSQEACERFVLPDIDHDILAAIEAKKIAFDGASAKTCLATIAARSCDSTSADARAITPACARTFTGLLDEGATCAFDGECASGACNAPDCSLNECCTGACEPTIIDAAVGEACNADRDCLDGFCGADRR